MNFRNWFSLNEESAESTDNFQQAVQQINSMFDTLKRAIKNSHGKGTLGFTGEVKDAVYKRAKEIQSLIDRASKNSGQAGMRDAWQQGLADSVVKINQLVSEAHQLVADMKPDSKGAFNVYQVLDNMQRQILDLVMGLRNDVLQKQIDKMRRYATKYGGDALKQALDKISSVGSDVNRVGINVERLRSGDRGIENEVEARFNLQQVLNSISNSGQQAYYYSPSGVRVNINADPTDPKSMDRIIRLMLKGGSSRVVVSPKGKPDNGTIVDLNDAGGAAQLQSEQ
jgi:hypothetical protein